MKLRLGIDIGGVIIHTDTDNPSLFFEENYLDAEPKQHAFESIANLVNLFGADNVFIVSKCGIKIQYRSREWLLQKDFYKKTHFKRENLIFCLERFEKAIICKELDINLFIDDRMTVLEYMNENDFLQLYLFCPNEREASLFDNSNNNKIKKINEWQSLEDDIRKLFLEFFNK
jgi:hypothetical protein